MADAQWIDVGDAEVLGRTALRPVEAAGRRLALSCVAGEFGAIEGTCLHAGGPLGEGEIVDGYVKCPWHGWRYHARTGVAHPPFDAIHLPAYPVRVERGRVLVDVAHPSARALPAHPPHPLARPVERAPGPIRVVGISTTNMGTYSPRFSTSEALLDVALAHAREALGAATSSIRLRDLSFRACEGYYSKAAPACTWPCTITQFDPKDELDRVYEAMVHGADVILVATPIRWGAPSSLYAKLVERLNCVQNQETIANRVLMRNKVVGFVVTGGQDNVQAVVGQMMVFFSEIGCHFPPFPFIAHSRGWSAEDMENNVREVRQSEDLRHAARELAGRCVGLSRRLLAAPDDAEVSSAGRKGNEIDIDRRGEAGA